VSRPPPRRHPRPRSWLEVPRVSALLAVPGHDAGGPALRGGHGHVAISPLSASTASGSASSRAVRYTLRVLCSAPAASRGRGA
jgi:hypothetical protein